MSIEPLGLNGDDQPRQATSIRYVAQPSGLCRPPDGRELGWTSEIEPRQRATMWPSQVAPE